MMNRHDSIVRILLWILTTAFSISASVTFGYANPIEGGVTQVVTNTWVVPEGDLFVGRATSNNSLIMKNGIVRNTVGYVGSFDGSNSNIVEVRWSRTTQDSLWQNSEALYIGGHREGTNWVDGGTGNVLEVDRESGVVIVGDTDVRDEYDKRVGIVVGDASGAPELVVANGSGLECGGTIYIGYGTNETGSVEVRGEGSYWHGYTGGSAMPGFLHVGVHGSGNRMTVHDGGTVEAIAILGYGEGSDNNLVRVTDPGSLLGKGYFIVGEAGSGNRLEVSNGARMNGSLVYLGYRSGSDNNSMLVSGNGTVASVRLEMRVGAAGSGNTLWINDGAGVINTKLPRYDYYGMAVGLSPGSDENSVRVTGDGSFLKTSLYHMGGNLGYGRTWYAGGRGNALHVEDGGLVEVNWEMHNRNHSLVEVDGPQSQIVIDGANNPYSLPVVYYQDATSIFRFGVSSNGADSAFLSVGGTAEFEAGATVQYHSDIMLPDFETVFTNLLVEAGQLIVAGVTNGHDLGELEVIKLDSSLVELELWEQEQDIYGLTTRRHLAESAGFAPGSQLARVSGEIDALSVQGNAQAVNQINLLNGMSSSQQNAQLTQRYAQGAPGYRHNQTLIGGRNQVLSQSRRFQSSARSGEAEPSGPSGPADEYRELRGWVRGYGSWADDDGSAAFSGYDHNIYGTVVGLDKAYGNILLGAAGGYARSDLTQDNDDSSDAKTGYGMLYASWGTADWFGDLWAGYGQSRVETRTGTVLGGSGRFTADNVAFYVGGGRVIRPSGMNGVTLIPEVALMADYYDQPDYTDGLMKVEDYDRWSYQSRLGAALNLEKSLGAFVVKPELRAYWLHEFNDDPDRVGYSLAGGAGRYNFGVQAPVEDVLEAGLGLGIAFSDQLELVLDVDSRYSDQYKSVTAAGSIKYEF